MRNVKLERLISKLDNEIAAMNIAKKYLPNIEEITEVRDGINTKRQILANELYAEDHIWYAECCEVIEEMLNKKLEKEDQADLLETLKEKFGRQAPNASKKSSGLNAWLKELNIEYSWINNEESDWDTLIITGFGLYE